MSSTVVRVHFQPERETERKTKRKTEKAREREIKREKFRKKIVYYRDDIPSIPGYILPLTEINRLNAHMVLILDMVTQKKVRT